MFASSRRFAGGGGGGATTFVLLLVVMARVAVADDFFSPLSPLLAPVIGSICKTVGCGKGNCTATATGFPGYRCECEPGWTQMHVGDELSFMPCVVPNCSIDTACSNTTAPAPAPVPPPKNFSLSDPCELAYCGSGGTCKNGTGLSYHCECHEGFINLLNITTMPCFQNCSIGADCASIGLRPSANSSQSPGSASISNNGNAPAFGSVSDKILLPLLMLASLIACQAI